MWTSSAPATRPPNGRPSSSKRSRPLAGLPPAPTEDVRVIYIHAQRRLAGQQLGGLMFVPYQLALAGLACNQTLVADQLLCKPESPGRPIHWQPAETDEDRRPFCQRAVGPSLFVILISSLSTDRPAGVASLVVGGRCIRWFACRQSTIRR